MAEIFISYKSERRPAAEHFAEILSDYGYSVWWDYALVSGRDFGAQIEKELRASKAVIVLWCSRAIDSEWVREEAALAKRLGKLIPTMIEKIELPLGFGLTQTVDLTDWDGAPHSYRLTPLLRDIAAMIGRPPNPNPDGLNRTERAWRRFGSPSLRDFAIINDLERHAPSRTLPNSLSPKISVAPPSDPYTDILPIPDDSGTLPVEQKPAAVNRAGTGAPEGMANTPLQSAISRQAALIGKEEKTRRGIKLGAPNRRQILMAGGGIAVAGAAGGGYIAAPYWSEWFPSTQITVSGRADGIGDIQLVKTFKSPNVRLSFSPDCTRLAVAGINGVDIIDVSNGNHIGNWGGHSNKALFSLDGTHLLLVNGDSTANILRVSDMYPLVTLKGHTDSINGGGFSPDGQWLVTASDDGTARLWNARTGSPGPVLGPVSQDAVMDAIFSPDGSRVATISDIIKHAANVWNSHDGEHLTALPAVSFPEAAAFSSDGNQLISAEFECSITISNVADGKSVKQFPAADGQYAASAVLSSDRARAFFGLQDGTIRLLSCSDGKLLGVLKGHHEFVMGLAVSTDGKLIASRGDDEKICIWHVTAA